MAPAEGRNVRNKLFSTILAVIFMIKIFTSSQVIVCQHQNMFENVLFFALSASVNSIVALSSFIRLQRLLYFCAEI